MSQNKLFSYDKCTVDLQNGMSDLYHIIKQLWNVNPCQVRIDYNEDKKYWEVRLTNKLGETFAFVGTINFDPNEDREQKSKA